LELCIDDNTAAVTSGESSSAPGINIVNIAGLSITKFVPLPDKPYGITYYDDSLICCVVNKNTTPYLTSASFDFSF
jgi:hypothetical protein